MFDCFVYTPPLPPLTRGGMIINSLNHSITQSLNHSITCSLNHLFPYYPKRLDSSPAARNKRARLRLQPSARLAQNDGEGPSLNREV